MIQVIKKEKVGGIVHETIMSFSQPEWALISQHYGKGNITFEPTDVKKVVVDNKPDLRDYETNRQLGSDNFKKEDWSKALYYFKEALKDKDSVWLRGRINKCNTYLDENSTDR